MSEQDEAPSAAAAPVIEDIEFEDLKMGLEEGTLRLVDVRDPQELITHGKIPCSVNIPLPEIPDAFRNLTEEEFKGKYGFSKRDADAGSIVFSCRSGKRAEAAIAHVFEGDNSITHFRLYKGSFLDWVAKGGTVEK